MRMMTPALLVAAVTELSKGTPLVRLRDVQAWCDRNSVNYQGEGLRNQAIWDADAGEARGEQRLLKFKSGECKQSRVGWAPIARGTKAREAAARLGWQELFWTGEAWERPQTATPLQAPSMHEQNAGVEAGQAA